MNTFLALIAHVHKKNIRENKKEIELNECERTLKSRVKNKQKNPHKIKHILKIHPYLIKLRPD